MSEPSASGTMPEASAHAAPPDEPPAERVGSTGLRVVPKIVLKVCEPAANSGTLVLPITTTPAPPDPLDDQLVGVGDVVGEQRRAVRRPPARDVVGVLERERQPVQRPDLGAGRQRLVGRRGARPGPLLVERDDRVELGVALGDPGQVQVEQLARRDLPARVRRRAMLAGASDVDGEVSSSPVRRPDGIRRRPKTARDHAERAPARRRRRCP